MFYQPGKNNHGLPYDPFKACVVPRPIGWISTVSLPRASQPSNDSPSPRPDSPNTLLQENNSINVRHNLAPYSQFNNLTFDPPYIMFSGNQKADPLCPGGNTQKDTVRNVEATGVFVWNLATWDLREAVNATAQGFPHGVDEFERAGLEKEYSRVVSVGGEKEGRRIRVPMVKRSPVKFECVYYTTLKLPGKPPVGTADVVIGRVVGVHIAEWVLTDGKLDVRKMKPIARCGYYEYAVVTDTFEMIIPGLDEAMLAGLEGSRERLDRLKGPKL